MTSGFVNLPQSLSAVASSGSNTVPCANSVATPITPLPDYSDVRLGYKRTLKNISCNVFLQVQYTNGSGYGSSAGNPTHALPTFTLYRNRIPVFVSSAQVAMTYNGPYTGGSFSNANTYGIYADFVNPIELWNSDEVEIGLSLTGFDLRTAADIGDGTDTQHPVWVASTAGIYIQPNGTIAYSEDPA